MTEKNHAAIRRQLLDQLGLISEDVEHGLVELSSRDDRHHIADLDDLAGDSSSDAVLFEHMRSSGVTLEQVQRAIERIDEGTYGVCEECDGEIGEARLAALPFVTHCIECRRKLEETSG